jgi:hypothetical protein
MASEAYHLSCTRLSHKCFLHRRSFYTFRALLTDHHQGTQNEQHCIKYHGLLHTHSTCFARCQVRRQQNARTHLSVTPEQSTPLNEGQHDTEYTFITSTDVFYFLLTARSPALPAVMSQLLPNRVYLKICGSQNFASILQRDDKIRRHVSPRTHAKSMVTKLGHGACFLIDTADIN